MLNIQCSTANTSCIPSNKVLSLNHLPFNIIIVSLCYFHIDKIADDQFLFTFNNYFIIYFYTIKFCTAQITAGFFFINQYFKCFTNLFLIFLKAYLLLHFHYFLGTFFFFFCRYIINQIVSACTFFVAVCKNTYTVETHFL